MKKILAKFLLILGLISLFPTAAVFAENEGLKACEGVENLYTQEELAQLGCGDKTDVKPGQVAVDIIYVVISVMGVLAVIMIVIGGIWYIVSQGDPTRTKRGRDTVIFASLGLVIVLLAFAIVNFIGGALNK